MAGIPLAVSPHPTPAGSSVTRRRDHNGAAARIELVMRRAGKLLAVIGIASTFATVASASAPGLPLTYADAKSGITLRYPQGWRVSQEPLRDVTDPVQRFVLSNRSRLPGARLAPRPHQVLAQLVEVVPPLPLDLARIPARPRRFRLPRLGRMEGFDGDRWAEIAFRDRGRAFLLFVGVGVAAAGARAELLSSLDSLAIRS